MSSPATAVVEPGLELRADDHRMGPVETEDDRSVQRCLRCDRRLYIVGRKSKPRRVGMVVTDGRCPGGIGVHIRIED